MEESVPNPVVEHGKLDNDDGDSPPVQDASVDQDGGADSCLDGSGGIVCDVCKRSFSSKPNMYKHQRNVHNVTPNLTGNSRCPESNCEYSCQLLTALRAHLVEKHGKEFEEMKISFLTYADFIKWKTEEEKQTRSRFVSNTGIKRQINGKEKKYYTCHRSGVFVPRGTGKKKMKTQGTCRIGRTCTASMEMEKDGGGVHVIYNRTHMGHANTVGYLTLTDEERIVIAGKLLQGATFEKILDEIKDNDRNDKGVGCSSSVTNSITGLASDSRMLMLKRKDLHNIVREFNLVPLDKCDQVDTSTVMAWVNRYAALGELSPVVYVKYHGHEGELPSPADAATMVEITIADARTPSPPPPPPSPPSQSQVGDYEKVGDTLLSTEDFMLVLMTTGQRALVQLVNNTVCIDSIHGVGERDVKLVTVLVIDEYGAGVPVAFCVTNRVDFETLATFFGAVRRRVGAPVVARTFVSDDSPTYYSAWSHAMGTVSADHLLCTWDVDRIWRQRSDKIGGGRDKQALVYKALRALLRECNRATFEQLLEPFCTELLSDPDTMDFGEYFRSQYAVKPQVWAQCYRVESDVDTNMYLEGMHRTLEECYLQGKKHRHIDRLLDILLGLVRDKTAERLVRMCKGRQQLQARKLSSVLQRHRAGSIVSREDVCVVVPDRLWTVAGTVPRSSATAGVEGDREVAEVVEQQEETCVVEHANSLCPVSCKLRCKLCDICIHMYLCSCWDFLVDTNICKHIHAVAIGVREERMAAAELESSVPTKVSPVPPPIRHRKRSPLPRHRRDHKSRVRHWLPRRLVGNRDRVLVDDDGEVPPNSDAGDIRVDRVKEPIGDVSLVKPIEVGTRNGLDLAADQVKREAVGGRGRGRAKVRACSRPAKNAVMMTRSGRVVKSAKGRLRAGGARGPSNVQERQLSAKLQMLVDGAASRRLDKTVVRKMNRKLDLLLKILNQSDEDVAADTES